MVGSMLQVLPSAVCAHGRAVLAREPSPLTYLRGLEGFVTAAQQA